MIDQLDISAELELDGLAIGVAVGGLLFVYWREGHVIRRFVAALTYAVLAVPAFASDDELTAWHTPRPQARA